LEAGSGLWGSLSAPADPLAVVKGLGSPGGEGIIRDGRREEGMGRGPQFEKNDPP